MPTIHIQSDDHSVIARIVTDLLGYGQRVRFTADNDDQFDVGTSEAWQAAIDPSYETRTEAGLRLMEEIAAHEREQALIRFNERKARWHEDERNYEVYVSVPCEYCKAQANDHCVTVHGNKCERPYVHAARRRDAWQDEIRVEKLIPVADWADYGDIDRIEDL